MLVRGVSVPVPVPAVPPGTGQDRECRCGQELARAETAESKAAELEGAPGESEVRALEWKREPVQARCALSMLRTTFGSGRRKPAAPRADLTDLHRSRSARSARRLEKEAARPEALPREAGIHGGRNPVTGLRRETARLKDTAARQAEEPEELRAGTGRLRPARAAHAKARFGSGGGRKGTSGSGSGRRRGRQAGRRGHGRTPRPETERSPGIHDPPEAARACPCCGQPCVMDGSHGSGAVGTGARAHVRTVRRSRRRRTCGCAPAPKEAAARPAARLFPGTACGTGFLACFLFGRCACHRPLDRAAAWMRDRGLPVPSGALAGGVGRMMPLSAPLPRAVPERMKDAGTLHGDGTGWRARSLKGVRGTGRAWLRRAVSRDAARFRAGARRGAGAAGRPFAGVAPGTVPVRGACPACRRPARVPGGVPVPAWRWSHVRRKSVQAAAGNGAPEKRKDRWLDRTGRLFRLNRVRLKRSGPEAGTEGRPRRSGTAHRRPRSAADRLSALAEKEPAGPAGPDRRAKALDPPVRHRGGLSVFPGRPEAAMDSSLAGRSRRGPVIGRKLPFGSGSLEGARLPAMTYGICGTLRMNGTDVRKWPGDRLAACAGNGGQPPDGLAPWLPRAMGGDRRRALKAAE